MTLASRTWRKRTYLLCPPEFFAVEYAINPWMDTSAPVDTELAVKQWQALRDALVDLGHDIHLLEPAPGLPDMVFAANGGFMVDRVVYGAKFAYPQRVPEAQRHEEFYRALGWTFVRPTEVNEGEGDFAYLPDRGLILAGYGYRTRPAAHAQAQEVLARPSVSLKLVDPRFYHLDTALAAIDDGNIAYFPGAFSGSSQRVLATLFPDALLADEADALAFGLNLVSDGRHVLVHAEATGMVRKLDEAGYLPVPVDLSELKKSGGAVKCCVAELRH